MYTSAALRHPPLSAICCRPASLQSQSPYVASFAPSSTIRLHNLSKLTSFHETKILSGNFFKRYGKDIINIHHGLLPSFKASNPSRQAFDCGVNMIGDTTHFVTDELDAGPIIEQIVERVFHKDNLQCFV